MLGLTLSHYRITAPIGAGAFTRDGRRVLASIFKGPFQGLRLHVLTNWTSLLNRKASSPGAGSAGSP